MGLNAKKAGGISTLAVVLIVVLVVAVVVAAAAAVMVLPFIASWQFGQATAPEGLVTGSGNLVTEEMEFSDFTMVEAGNAFQLEITRSDSYSVSVSADDNLFDYIQVSKQGQALKIGLRPGQQYRSLTLRAEITMPDLYELQLSGASSGVVQGFSSSHKFVLRLSGASSTDMVDMSAGSIEVDLSGSSRTTGDLEATGEARFALSGASTARLEGAAKDLIIRASGASSLELSEFPVRTARVNLSGASRARINLDGRLDADLSGASTLLYIGDPVLGDIETSGGSTIAKE